jgi:cytidine deaminase
MTAHPASAASTPDARTLAVLRERAMAAMDRAYAPYSGFRVGAALLGSDGSISDGCNVENASYPAGICAERAALAAAVAHGERSFVAIAIATEAQTPTPPCGLCRQALVEFSPALTVLSVSRTGGDASWPLSALLPHAFTQESLSRGHR